jgi:RHS repeat-associated protein
MTQATWSSGNTLTYTYDNANNLLTAKDQNGTITNTYDALGRMTSTQDVFGLTLTYSYDNADRRTLRQDSKNGVLTSVYDSGNRVTTMMFGGTGQTQARVDLTYSNRNELTGVTRYSDVGGGTLAGTTSYSYDDASRVTSITSKNAAGTALSTYSYLFDNADRVTQETWSSGASNGTHTYAYDTTSQLTQDGTTGFAYDANGNRTTAGTLTYQPAVNNRVTNDGVYTYGYDAESNLTGKTKIAGGETWTYGYDLRNRLTSVVESGASTFQATYTYDVLGGRVLEDRTDNSGSHTTTRFSYDGKQVWAELSTSNVVQARYLYGDGETQVLERTDGSGNVQWYLTDRLGNVRDIASSTVVSNHVEYQAFGAIASESTPGTGEGKLYTGLYLDRATGIVFADERTLLVTTGQWMQEDPKMFGAGQANLREYVGNDATNATDPSGNVVFLVHGINDDGRTFYANFQNLFRSYYDNQFAPPPGTRLLRRQEVIGFKYSSILRTRLNQLLNNIGSGAQMKDTTSIFHAVGLLSLAPLSIDLAAQQLADDIADYRQNNPGEPVNIIAHSNGTIVALLALEKGAVVDNAVLLGSPLAVRQGIAGRRANLNSVISILTGGNVKGTMYNVYSKFDGVVSPLGGAAPWGIKNPHFQDVDWSEWTRRSTFLGIPNGDVHMAFVGPDRKTAESVVNVYVRLVSERLPEFLPPFIRPGPQIQLGPIMPLPPGEPAPLPFPPKGQ